MPTAKIHIKFHSLEVDYEGDAGFIKEGLVKLCREVSTLNVPKDAHTSNSLDGHTPSKSMKSTMDIAVKLQVKSGPDLVMAAAACLHFAKGMEEFKRAEILSEMKSAKAFYKQTYNNNLSKSLEGLLKAGRLSHRGSDIYALQHAELEAIGGKLAGH